MRRVLVLSAILLLAACSKSAPAGQTAVAIDRPAPPGAAADAAASAASTPDAATSAAPSGPSAPASPAAGPPPPMLAYSYAYGIQAPADRVRPLMTAQQQACIAAGPTVCQVTGASISTDEDQVSARLTLRATPAWLKGYDDKLAGAARDAGGKLSHEETTSEDLTHDIVDTDAAVKAKTALRDRLQALLETHPGNLSDLLAVEEAVSKAQADLDATTSDLTVMRERVAMSDVTIDYTTSPGLRGVALWGILLTVWTTIAVAIAIAVSRRRASRPAPPPAAKAS